MKTDWINYRQLEKGEIIRHGDQELSPDAESDGWDEIAACRIGAPASDPLCYGHMKYRRLISATSQGSANANTNQRVNPEDARS